MTQIQPLASGSSPFDAIRRVGPDGSEFWSARDLMPLLGYSTWPKFTDAIERAKAACANAGTNVDQHFEVSAGAGNNPSGQGGRPSTDFHLSRYAAYLVAMNGDPRKSEIAAAQTYFAVKAREAEVRSVKLTVEFLTDTLANLALEEHKDELVQRAFNEHFASFGGKALNAKRWSNAPKGIQAFVQLTIDLGIGGSDTQAIEGGA